MKTTIKLQPQPKDAYGYYVFHNGYEHLSYTNRRKYIKALREHQHFLNSCYVIKRRKLLDAFMHWDLEAVNRLTGEFIRLEHLLKLQGGYTGLVNVNNILIDIPKAS